MSFTAFLALVRRDLRLFFLDRRAMLMSFAAPILIASFFGYLFGGTGTEGPASKIQLAAVDQDNSDISRKVIAALAADQALDVKPRRLAEVRQLVQSGKTTIAAVIPPGFGDRAVQAFMRAGSPPEIALFYDPSHGAEVQMVRGILTQHVMEVVSSEAFNGRDSQKYLDQALRDLNGATGMDPADRPRFAIF